MAIEQREQPTRFNSFDRILMEDYAEETRKINNNMQANLERLQRSVPNNAYGSYEDLVRAIQEA